MTVTLKCGKDEYLCRLDISCQCLLYYHYIASLHYIYLQRPRMASMAMFPALGLLSVVLLVVVVFVDLGTT